MLTTRLPSHPDRLLQLRIPQSDFVARQLTAAGGDLTLCRSVDLPAVSDSATTDSSMYLVALSRFVSQQSASK